MDRWQTIRKYDGHVMCLQYARMNKLWMHPGEGLPPVTDWEVLPVQWKKWSALTFKSANHYDRKPFKGFGKDIIANGSSTSIGILMAVWFGAKRIGIIGHDLTTNHGLYPHLPFQNRTLALMRKYSGVEIYNLSKHSKVTAIPKLTQKEFECLP